MTDNVTMVKTRADEVAAVFKHLHQNHSQEVSLVLTGIAFSSIHSQMEGGRMASVMAEAGVNVANAIGHLADTVNQSFGDLPETTPPKTAVCKKCGVDCEAEHYVCDKDMDGEYCPTCFNDTICGRGGHGEGCPTLIHGSGT